MDILPAIDIRKGRVVRLSQGEAARETVYADDPLAQAERFFEAGARWVHVVDLDRAFGDGSNVALVGSIARAAEGRAFVQYGGGLRTPDAIAEALDAGVTRAVIGTAAVSNPALVARAVATHGASWLAVGLDARDGKVAVRGWTESSGLTVLDVARRGLDAGARTIVYTDIARDGMLSGPDLAGCSAITQLGAVVIASGGFATVADVRRASEGGVSGVILGRSLYERTIDHAEALSVA